MPVWQAIVLGVIQGLTEFLPISSTAHLIVARQLMGHEHPEDAFTMVIQLGTLAAVYIYFRAEVVSIIVGLLTDLRQFRIGSTPGGRLAWLMIIATLPVVAVGLLFHHWLKETFFNLYSISIVAIVFALLLGAAEWWAHRRARLGIPGRTELSINWLDALWIGTWQAFAAMPGGSRSGTTITGGLFDGLTRTAAARFSFLLSLLSVLGAGLKELYGEYKKIKKPDPDGPPSLFQSGDDLTSLIVGTVVSGVVGYFVIKSLLRFLQSYSTDVFIAYRIVFGLTILSLLATGVLKS